MYTSRVTNKLFLSICSLTLCTRGNRPYLGGLTQSARFLGRKVHTETSVDSESTQMKVIYSTQDRCIALHWTRERHVSCFAHTSHNTTWMQHLPIDRNPHSSIHRQNIARPRINRKENAPRARLNIAKAHRHQTCELPPCRHPYDTSVQSRVTVQSRARLDVEAHLSLQSKAHAVGPFASTSSRPTTTNDQAWSPAFCTPSTPLRQVQGVLDL